MIAGQQQGPFGLVPEREGEHAAQVLGAVFAVLLIEVQNDLDVGRGLEAVPRRDQLPPQFRAVVDLAVADEVQVAGLVSRSAGCRWRGR
jgi:hypothetical protein